MSNKLEFKPDDGFDATPFGDEADYYGNHTKPLKVITIDDANARLKEMIAEAPRVFANLHNAPLRQCEHLHADWFEHGSYDCTHSARLIEIESLEKKE